MWLCCFIFMDIGESVIFMDIGESVAEGTAE